MKITVEMISLLLQELEPEVHITNKSHSTIPGLFFLSDGELLPGCGYLCWEKEIQEDADVDIIWFCVPDGSREKMPEKVNYIFFRSATSPTQIMNMYTKMIMRITDWDRSMHQAIISDCTLNKLIGIGTEVIENPIVVFDAGFTILGFSKTEAERPKLFDYLISTGYTPPEIMQQLMLQDFVQDIRNSQKPVVSPNAWIEGQIDIHRGFHYAGKNIGCATVFMIHNYHSGNRDIAEIFFANLESWMIRNQKQNMLGTYGYEYFLPILISGYYQMDSDILRRTELMGLTLSGNYFLMMLEFKYSSSIPSDYVWKRLDNICAELKPFVHEDRIYVLGVSPHKEELVKQLREYLSLYEFYCYISDGFYKLNNIYDARIQCEIAQSMVAILKYDEDNCYYERISPYVGLDLCRKLFHDELLYDSRYRKLKNWDKKRGTTLCHTLCTYLKNECDLNKTSKELYCHRNTVNLHVKKAMEIMECDLADFGIRFALLQSFMLEEICANADQMSSL